MMKLNSAPPGGVWLRVQQWSEWENNHWRLQVCDRALSQQDLRLDFNTALF